MPAVSWFPIYIVIFLFLFIGTALTIIEWRKEELRFVGIVLIVISLGVSAVLHSVNGFFFFPDRSVVLNSPGDWSDYVHNNIYTLDTSFLIAYQAKTQDQPLKIDIGAELAKRKYKAEQELRTQQAQP